MAVLIDFPEIHFRLAREFHRLGIPVIYFVSPQLWAWKQHRIRLVERYVKRMLVIFPFEERFYRERGVEAEFVGHPLADLPMPAGSREDFAAENGLDAGKTWVGILPGSRMKEIEANLPEMLEAARGLIEDIPQGLKPRSFCGAGDTAVEDAEKRGTSAEASCETPAGAEARAHFATYAARLKSCPDTSCPTAHFSASSEAVPFQSSGFEGISQESTEFLRSLKEFLRNAAEFFGRLARPIPRGEALSL